MNERSKMNMSHLMAAGVFLSVSALVLWVSVLITSKSEAEQESYRGSADRIRLCF